MICDILREWIHPLLLKGMVTQRKQRGQILYVLNQLPQVNEKNVIFVANHSCKHDFPIIGEVIKRRTYVLAGRQGFDLIDKISLFMNGVVYVDRHSKNSKKEVSKKMIKLLKNGQNVCLFPEGTWNLSPSKPMLPMYWGCIDLARYSGCPIVPIIIEYKGTECYVKFGKAVIVLPEDDKQSKFRELEEEMATVKWEIWEQFPVALRAELDLEEWDREVQRRITEYPKFNYEYEQSVIRK